MINLFGASTAIEQNDLDFLTQILSNNTFSINDLLKNGFYSYFNIKLNLLDVALMLDNKEAAKILLNLGAAENPKLSLFNKRQKNVLEVFYKITNQIQNFKVKSVFTKEDEKKYNLWKTQFFLINKMKTTLEQNYQLPNKLDIPRCYVSGENSVTIELKSLSKFLSCVVIKYKVEWCKVQTFENIDGFYILTDLRKTKIVINNLVHNQTYFFRLAAGSMFGYGEFTITKPKSLKISSWKDNCKCLYLYNNQLKQILQLNDQVEKHKQSIVWETMFPQNIEINVKKKKLSIRCLFSASSKFVKNIQRGVYLASIIYTEDKVLCTVDDCLPVLCVDESFTTITNDDLLWLMKLSLCWDQVPYLLESMNNTTCSNNFQFRVNLLETVTSMMNALGVWDIGRIYHVPLTISNNITFLISVNFLNKNQIISGLAVRWIRIEKLIKKKNLSCVAFEILYKELLNILNFFELSQISLDSGLYLCYLRLKSSLNVIRVTVPENIPSVLPFALIRQNSHVSQEEWEWLKQIDCTEQKNNVSPKPTSLQYTFHQQLSRAAQVLIQDLNIEFDSIQNYRLFNWQVLQIHENVSFILIMPKAEDLCQVNPNSFDEESYFDNYKRCTLIPVPVFQIINLYTYQPEFLTTYCRLSVFIEHFIMILQCEQRQCLLENDAKIYADQLEKMNDFQHCLESIWQASRWINNIALITRDKQIKCALPLTKIIAPPISNKHFVENKIDVKNNINQDENYSIKVLMNSLKLSSNNVDKNGLNQINNVVSVFARKTRSNHRHMEQNIRRGSASNVWMRKFSETSIKNSSLSVSKKKSLVSFIQTSLNKNNNLFRSNTISYINNCDKSFVEKQNFIKKNSN